MITVVVAIIFLTAVAVITPSFQKQKLQSLHELYDRYAHTRAAAGKETEEGEGDYCAVCLSHVSRGEEVRSLPVCNHSFHAVCVGAWLKNHSTCPLCRNKVTDHLHHSQKHRKIFRQSSLIDICQSFSDLLVVLIYKALPPNIRESFPLLH